MVDSVSSPQSDGRRGAEEFRDRLAAYGSRIGLVAGDNNVSFAELLAAWAASRIALAQAGVGAGRIVLLRGDFGLAGVAALLALAEARCIVAPVAVNLENEIAARAEAARADWLVDSRLPGPLRVSPLNSAGPSAAPPENALIARLRATGHAGLILFSSGTTGEPKATLHDFDNLLASYIKRKPRHLALLAFLLFDHIGGLNTLLNALAGGATLVIPPSRDPEIVAASLARHRVNILPASPTFLNLLLASGALERHDLSALRVITYGTEHMPESLLPRLRAAFPNARLLQTFGTSETGIVRTDSPDSSSTWLKFDDPGVEHKIVEGELWLRSQTQALGYLNAPTERFTPDGWFRTGDSVEVAPDGRYRILGRRTDLINVGGEKVWPGEVESVLLESPEISACLVRGEANALTGQTVVAEVVPAQPLTVEERGALKRRLRQHCRARLAAYKTPTQVIFLDQLPVTARFKTSRPQPTA